MTYKNLFKLFALLYIKFAREIIFFAHV